MSKLEWVCVVCKEKVADNLGYITINYRDIKRYQDEVIRFNEKYAGKPVPVTMIPVGPRWKILHWKCDPDPDSPTDYPIEIERIRTVLQLLDWTAHLFEKNWFQDTDWDQIIRRAMPQIPREEL